MLKLLGVETNAADTCCFSPRARKTVALRTFLNREAVKQFASRPPVARFHSWQLV